MEDSSEQYLAACRKAEEDAGREMNHYGIAESEGYNERHVCSCGWESPWGFKGAAHARQLWVKHIQEDHAEINYPETPRGSVVRC